MNHVKHISESFTGGGTDGREVELNKSVTHIQWRYVGDSVWIDIVPLSEITGPAGSAGAQGEQGLPGNDGAQGIQGIPGNDGAQGIPGNDGSQGLQ